MLYYYVGNAKLLTSEIFGVKVQKLKEVFKWVTKTLHSEIFDI